MPPDFSRDSLSPCPCAVQVCDVKQLQDMVTTKLNALPNYKFKREGGGYRSYPHQFNATYFSACQESPRVRRLNWHARSGSPAASVTQLPLFSPWKP
jgi:hypothetical protein